MAWLWVCLAWAGKWDGVESNIVSKATIALPPAAVYARIDDWNGVRAIYDVDCVTDWVIGDPTGGVGAQARMTYNHRMMHRRLTAKITKLIDGRYVDLDHLGNKGFVTRFELSETPTGTAVTMTTYTNPPPWPFKPYFFKKVKPAWEACQEKAMANLAKP
jgi:hypothetical protein